MRSSARSFALFTLPFLLLALACSLFAQDLDDVTISGRIADSNGLPIVGAVVTATEVTSGTERTVTTNEGAVYNSSN
jgi:hypothetical protein